MMFFSKVGYFNESMDTCRNFNYFPGWQNCPDNIETSLEPMTLQYLKSSVKASKKFLDRSALAILPTATDSNW